MDDALNAAMRMFWQRGFENVSVTELAVGMGISRQSLYGAFGSKEELFQRSFAFYKREHLQFIWAALSTPSARSVATSLLDGVLNMLTSGRDPCGCFGLNSPVRSEDNGVPLKAEILSLRASIESEIVHRFTRAQAAGELPKGTTPEALAQFLIVLIQGMAAQCHAGASRKRLQQLANTGLSVWPTP